MIGTPIPVGNPHTPSGPNRHPDLYGVVIRYGLNPKPETSELIRFHCPFCSDPSKRKTRRRGTAVGYSDSPGTWWCFRCFQPDARLLALDILKHHGDEEAALPPRRKRPKPKPLRARLDVDRAWRDLVDNATIDSLERLAAWGHKGRGWPRPVADYVSNLEDIAWAAPGDSMPRGAATLRRHGHDVERPLLFALRDADGRVRTMARRWPDGSRLRRPDGPKSLSMPKKVVGETEGVYLYGNLPVAVAAARNGDPVYVTEGAPDTVAMAALLGVQDLPGAVIGAFNAQTAPKLIRAFRDVCARDAIVPPRVIFLPHMGDRDDVGERTAEKCVELLKGRAGSSVCRLPVMADGHADVSAFLAENGTSALLEEIRLAPVVHPAPAVVADIESELEVRLRRAVIEVTNRVTLQKGRRNLVVFQVAPGCGKSRSALKLAASIVSGAWPIPTATRKPKGWPEGKQWPPPERSVVFALADHKLAAEKIIDLGGLAPGCPTHHLGGLMQHCKYGHEVHDIYPAVGRYGVCGPRPKNNEEPSKERCEHADECPGAIGPHAPRGKVTFAAHSMVPHLKPDLTIIDESPGVLDLTVVGSAEVETLWAPKFQRRVKKWRRHSNPEAGDAAVTLAKILGPIAMAHADEVSRGEAKPYAKRIDGDELRALLLSRPSLRDDLEVGYAEDAAIPPKPWPSEVRRGFHRMQKMPSQVAFRVMRELWLWLHGQIEPPELEFDGAPKAPDPYVCVRVSASGAWALEVRKRLPLPNCPIIVLDATGEHARAEWEAAYPDWNVSLHRLDAQGAGPADAFHLKTNAYTRSKLMTPEGDLTREAPGRIRRALYDLAEKTRARHPRFDGQPKTTIGILTHKPIAEAMVELDEYDGRAAAIRRDVLDLEQRGFEVLVGYFGRDERGTNRFERVKGLAVIGDPLANLGDVDADSRALGLDVNDIYEHRTFATAFQAIHRARHLRRTSSDRVVLAYIGRKPPEVPGVAWDSTPIAKGRVPSSTGDDVFCVVYRVARKHFAIGAAVIRRECIEDPALAEYLDGVTDHVIDRAIVRVAEAFGWRRWTWRVNGRPGRPPTVWAESNDAVDSWANPELSKDSRVLDECVARGAAGGTGSAVSAENPNDSGVLVRMHPTSVEEVARTRVEPRGPPDPWGDDDLPGGLRW